MDSIDSVTWALLMAGVIYFYTRPTLVAARHD